jgi:hypothetical protein
MIELEEQRRNSKEGWSGPAVRVVEYSDSHDANGERWYGSLTGALDIARRVNEAQGMTVVTGIILDGVRLADEEIAGFHLRVRTVEELAARDAWVRALYDDIQTRTPAALAAAAWDREAKANPLTFGL